MPTYEDKLTQVLSSDSEWLAWSNNAVNTLFFAQCEFEGDSVEPKEYPCIVHARLEKRYGYITLVVSFEYKQKNGMFSTPPDPDWYISAKERIESRLRLFKDGKEVKVIYSGAEYISTLVDIVMDTNYTNDSPWKYQFKKDKVFYDISPLGETNVLPSKLGITI